MFVYTGKHAHLNTEMTDHIFSIHIWLLMLSGKTESLFSCVISVVSAWNSRICWWNGFPVFMALSVSSCKQTHQVVLRLLKKCRWDGRTKMFCFFSSPRLQPRSSWPCVFGSTRPCSSLCGVALVRLRHSDLPPICSKQWTCTNSLCTCNRSSRNQSTDITIHHQSASTLL